MCQRQRMMMMQHGGGCHYRGAGLLADAYQLALRKRGVAGHEMMMPGETHTILKVNGQNRVANFAGPGTRVKQRLQRGDQPVSEFDEIALAHDIRYSLAKTPQQIRDADGKFLKRARTSSDVPFNKRQAAAVAAKYAIESKTGVKYPTQGDMDTNDDGDATLTSKLREMEQRGFGKDPAAALKRKLMAHRRGARKRKGFGVAGRGLRLAGKGLRLAGKGPKTERLKNYVRQGWEAAKPHLKRYAMQAAKDYIVPAIQKKFAGGGQSGGFFIAIPALIAAGTAIAKAIALGAAGAVGAYGANRALAGRGPDENMRNAIQRVKLSIGDFSPAALKKIEHAQQILNNNPQAVVQASKLLEPVIKASLAQKLSAWGITKQMTGGCLKGGGSNEFAGLLAQHLTR